MAVLAILFASVLNSAAPAYMKLGDIKGEATDAGHVEEMDVLCFSHSLSRSNSATQPTLNEFVITKVVDKASPKLAEACAKGQPIPLGVLSMRKAGSTTTNDYYVIELENLLISGYQTGCGSGDSKPTESISMNFTQIKWIYEPQTSNGVPTGPIVTGRWPVAPSGP